MSYSVKEIISLLVLVSPDLFEKLHSDLKYSLLSQKKSYKKTKAIAILYWSINHYLGSVDKVLAVSYLCTRGLYLLISKTSLMKPLYVSL